MPELLVFALRGPPVGSLQGSDGPAADPDSYRSAMVPMMTQRLLFQDVLFGRQVKTGSYQVAL